MATVVINFGVLAVRIIALLLVVIAVACVAAGRGQCEKSKDACNSAFDRLKIDNWHKVKDDEEPVKGQYFVFVSSLVLALATVASLIMRVMGSYDFPSRIVSIMGIVLCIINGSLEVWYANGWNSPQQGSFYIQSWVAAAAFYFAALLMYAIDFTFPRK